MVTITYIKETSQVNEFTHRFGIAVKKGKKSFAACFESHKFHDKDMISFHANNIKILSSGIKTDENLIREIWLAISRLSIDYRKLSDGTDL